MTISKFRRASSGAVASPTGRPVLASLRGFSKFRRASVKRGFKPDGQTNTPSNKKRGLKPLLIGGGVCEFFEFVNLSFRPTTSPNVYWVYGDFSVRQPRQTLLLREAGGRKFPAGAAS